MKSLITLLLIFGLSISVLALAETPFSENPTLEISYTTLCEEFRDSSVTSIQKDAIWKEKYLGKRVAWKGWVSDVDQSSALGTFVTLDVYLGFNIISPRYAVVTVYVRKDLEANALALKKGQMVRFAGKLDRISGGSWCRISLEEGEINWVIE